MRLLRAWAGGVREARAGPRQRARIVLSLSLASGVRGAGFLPPRRRGASVPCLVQPNPVNQSHTPTHMKLLKYFALRPCVGAASILASAAHARRKPSKSACSTPSAARWPSRETSLRDVLLFTFDEINAKGGVMGKKIEPVVVDGASNWPLFAEKAKQLLEQDKVAVTFGCWTSVSAASPSCPSSRRTTACSSTPCSTKAKKSRRTSSTPPKP